MLVFDQNTKVKNKLILTSLVSLNELWHRGFNHVNQYYRRNLKCKIKDDVNFNLKEETKTYVPSMFARQS